MSARYRVHGLVLLTDPLHHNRRHGTSDGLVAVVLWSVGGLALTPLVIWLGSEQSSSASADEQTDFVLPKFTTLAPKNNAPVV